MLNEIKIAFRGLVKTPGFTAIAILTVALAIGANSAVFTLANAVLVRPLPYRQPSRLILLWEQFAAQGLDRIPVSPPEFQDMEKELKGVESIAAFNYTAFNMSTADNPERISGALVSPQVFPLLGVDAIQGRTFAQSEQGQGHDDVVVISERLLHRRFNSDPGLVGKSILLNGRSYTVIGIMPRSFEFPIPLFNVQGGQFAERVDIWKPVAFTKDELTQRGSRSYGVIARLRPGSTLGTAQAELQTMVNDWARRYPDNYSAGDRFGAKLYPFQEQVVGGMRKGLAILLGAVGFVLLIACANLATMLLARASGRERELAIRVALGAGPWQILRQLLTESVLLSLVGGAIGVLFSVWGLDLLKAVGARTLPRLSEVNLDFTVLGVMALLSIGTGILFGLVPALVSAKPELTEALKDGGKGASTGRRRNHLRDILVVCEIALALVLLAGAGLLMKSFVRLQGLNPGFNSHNVLTMEFALPSLKYPAATPEKKSADSRTAFYDEVQRRVAHLPGVEAAAWANILPLSGTNSDSSFAIEGRTMNSGSPYPDEEIRTVSAEYFRVLQTPLVRGRFFTAADNAEAPRVTVINTAMAKKYWPNDDPIGKRITFSDPRKPGPKWITIVGLVESFHHRALDLDPLSEYYLPLSQFPDSPMLLTIRSKQDPRSLTAAVRREVQAIDPEQPLANVRTFDAVVAESIAPRRLSALLLGIFSGIALLLAGVGTYGVISYLVVQRTHEIGVRMALGAQRRDVFALVVGHAFRLAVAGVVIGLVLAFFTGRALAAMLYRVAPFDPATLILVTTVLAGIAFLASYIPALRATKADPMIALGHNA
jgi:putative ABC transport system permease protein